MKKYPKCIKKQEHKMLYDTLSPKGKKEILRFIKKEKRGKC
jgi:hypothetical protein